MAEKKLLKKESLGQLFEKLKSDGRRILAPRKKENQIAFEEVSSPEEIAKEYIQTTTSAKFTVFPPCEELLRYRFEDKEVQIEDRKLDPPPTVIFGLRPCDAAGFSVLDAVFSWDYQDAFFQSRLEKTSVIGMSCNEADEYCFCTSVGGGPGNTKGSDILLTRLGSGDYLAEIITDKGEEIVSLAPDLFGPAPSDQKDEFLAEVPVRFEHKELTTKLGAFFDNDLWVEQSLRCVGCGACAFVCPVCVCFDIQDEADKNGGTRLRCWDSCGFSLFTLHTSGHNPREVQSQRWRQRVMHKFSYLPDRFEIVGCVGCGRCARSCPADMNLVEHLKEIVETK